MRRATTIIAVLMGTSLAAAGLVPAASASHRIIGGRTASQGQFGFMTFIVYFNDHGSPDFGCSGTLVASNVVLTAGHCTVNVTTGVAYRARNYRVVTGTDDWADATRRMISTVSRVIPDPHFDPATARHDDGLLVLSSPVKPTPVAMWNSGPVSGGTKAEIAGWGAKHANEATPRPTQRLRWATTVIQSSAYCGKRSFFPFAPSSELCTNDTPTESTGACKGDSGGPLLVKSSSAKLIEVGVTSNTAPNCSTRKPNYFTAVGPIYSWVSNQIKANAP